MTTETQRNGAALRVGWIGAGRMGGAMAIRVANAGQPSAIGAARVAERLATVRRAVARGPRDGRKSIRTPQKE